MKKAVRNIITTLLLCALLGQSVFAAQGMTNFTSKNIYIEGQFKDVPKDEWYAVNVRTCFRSGLMSGVSDNMFNPNGLLKLSEAISMAARVHNIYRNGPGVFGTTKPWYDGAVKYAISAKIISANQFKNYDAYATRAEMAYIFTNALPADELAIINVVSSLPDVAEADPYYENIMLLYRAGILSGTDKYGTYKPNDNIKRSEAAVIISKMTVPSMRKSFTLVPVAKPPVVPPVNPPVVPPVNPPVTTPDSTSFDTVTQFSQGLSVVSRNGLYGYCDTTGKLITEIKYAQAFPFCENKGVVLSKVSSVAGSPDYYANPLAYRLGYVDFTGTYHTLNYIIENTAWTSGEFHNGYVTIEKNDSPMIDNHKLLLNSTGLELKLPNPTGTATRFIQSGLSQDLILVADTSKSKYFSYSFVDIHNNTAIELPSYDKLKNGTGLAVIDAKPFYGGMAPVQAAKFENGNLISKGWGAVNLHGDMVVMPKYGSFLTSDDVAEFPVFAKHIATATMPGDQVYLLLTDYGTEMLSGQYDSLSPATVKSPYILGEKNGLYTFLDTTGAIIFTCRFTDVQNFSDGYAAIQQNGLYGFMDLTGDVVINIMYEDVTDFSEGFAWGKLNGKWCIVRP